jgi:hypothetical protein
LRVCACCSSCAFCAVTGPACVCPAQARGPVARPNCVCCQCMSFSGLSLAVMGSFSFRFHVLAVVLAYPRPLRLGRSQRAPQTTSNSTPVNHYPYSRSLSPSFFKPPSQPTLPAASTSHCGPPTLLLVPPLDCLPPPVAVAVFAVCLCCRPWHENLVVSFVGVVSAS